MEKEEFRRVIITVGKLAVGKPCEFSPALSLSPSNGASGIEFPYDFYLEFTPFSSLSIGSGFVRLFRSSNDDQIQTWDIQTQITDNGSGRYTLESVAELDPNETYYFLVDFGIVEDDGCPFDGINVKGNWTFTTAVTEGLELELEFDLTD